MVEQVQITDNSKERIALELTQLIAQYEEGVDQRQNDAPREYFLKLYAQCLKTIHNRSYKTEE